MTLSHLIRELLKEQGRSETAGVKDVIVDDGTGQPYADVTGLGQPNEDTVVLVVEKFQK